MVVNILSLLFIVEVVLNISILKFRDLSGLMTLVWNQACLHFLLLMLNLRLRLFKSLVVFHVIKDIFIQLSILILFLQMLHEQYFEVVAKSQVFVDFSKSVLQTSLMEQEILPELLVMLHFLKHLIKVDFLFL